MSFISKKWIALALPFVIFSGLMFLVDGCMQFRMSKSEVDAYFANKERKGVLHHYAAGKRTIYYLEVGDSTLPLVVFVHGSPGSLSAFIDFMADTALLARAHLITVDRPGFGASNFGYAEPSLQKQAALLKPILENHKSQRPIILVGHSLGGPLIARMAMDYPGLVDGLVMVAPSIDPELEPDEWFRAPLATPFLKWMLPRSIRASNDEIYKLKPELEEMIPLWPQIKASTIVIQGTKDSLVPAANADFAKKMMTGTTVKVVMVEGMDHFVPWNHPYLIRNAILEMLNKVGRTE
ncbi:MAG TPA: alpha/beta hydrolase [Cyclobacteriaceae bacterium]|nr:alpha/beta hydrolase [Cyclobacteriaceae bacterium]